jgi:hypothetical protein
LVCHHSPDHGRAGVTFTYWDTIQEAQQALAELTPCDSRCIGVHTVVDLETPSKTCPLMSGITDGAIKAARRLHGVSVMSRKPDRTVRKEG